MCLEPQKRKVLVLGEMRELENFSQTLHEEVGERLGKLILKTQTRAFLFVVGKEAQGIITGLKRAVPHFDGLGVETVEEVIPLVQAQIKENDIVFVKGSRGIGLDKLVQKLK
jgi:UDP-N-acetylmuramoyl-tripeptide--D-alanyl-D-alanine ligase